MQNSRSGAVLQALRLRLGLSIAEASRLLEVNNRTFQRWERGVKPVPPGVFKLLEKLAR